MANGNHEHRSGINPRLSYPLTGVALGVGAPIGALMIRYLSMPGVRADARADIESNLFFYAYALIGSCLAFGAAGLIAGDRVYRLRRAEAFYHDLSELDPLTGLLNARAFRDRYARMLGRSVRYHTPIALLLIDVDRLKLINDRFGHEAGSLALRHVADAIRGAKRMTDYGARWGGDEFVLLLEGADRSAANRVATAALEAVRSREVQLENGSTPVTVTIGIAGGVPATEDEDYFAAADRALYAGKEAGRNRVSAAS